MLDDVPASTLSATQIAALNDAVRAEGLGLVALGGPHSFSLGGYARSPLQQVLPVSSLVPGNLQRRNLAISLVLDHSGQHDRTRPAAWKRSRWRARPRARAQRSCAPTRTRSASSTSTSSRTRWCPCSCSPARRTNASVDRTVAGLQADGGTNIYLGLKAGFEQLLASKAEQRHIILMTDGISQPANYAPLLAQLRREHISVATVALGADADRAPARRNRRRHRRPRLRHRQRQGTAADLRQRDAAERQAGARHRPPVGAARQRQRGRALVDRQAPAGAGAATSSPSSRAAHRPTCSRATRAHSSTRRSRSGRSGQAASWRGRRAWTATGPANGSGRQSCGTTPCDGPSAVSPRRR